LPDRRVSPATEFCCSFKGLYPQALTIYIGLTAYIQPRKFGPQIQSTSPVLKFFTSLPTSLIIPLKSLPKMAGSEAF